MRREMTRVMFDRIFSVASGLDRKKSRWMSSSVVRPTARAEVEWSESSSQIPSPMKSPFPSRASLTSIP